MEESVTIYRLRLGRNNIIIVLWITEVLSAVRSLILGLELARRETLLWWQKLRRLFCEDNYFEIHFFSFLCIKCQFISVTK